MPGNNMQQAVQFANDHESPWDRETTGTWGVHLQDPPPPEEVVEADASQRGQAQRVPALRELTFHQRAALLKALASHLREHRDELYALSARSGATRTDSLIDVDGGIGVLFGYASKAKRELPNDKVQDRKSTRLNSSHRC